MALLPVIALLALRRKGFADIGELAAATALALLANAFVCGDVADPHDRYGARMVWLAVFVGHAGRAGLAASGPPWAACGFGLDLLFTSTPGLRPGRPV